MTTFGRNNHAVRTDRWRYIRYANGDEELYDHLNDEYEWSNLASHAENATVKAELAKHFPTTNNPAVEGKTAAAEQESADLTQQVRRAKRKAEKGK